MEIKFCGAAGQVTGSAHLITLKSGFTILLDCGLYQGNQEVADKENQKWYFEPSEIDAMILSHAHIDHCGRVPKLVKDGFEGNIYATPATRSLALIMLLDSAKIQQSDAEYENKINKKRGHLWEVTEPLYQTEHVYQALSQFVTINYERWYKINDEVSFLFRDAGHILGSASVTLRIHEDEKTIYLGFTGDIGRPLRPIIKDPMPMPPCDYLICESTYGGRLHEATPSEYNHLERIIKDTCVHNKGKLIIPAFSLGRTQEIVYMMDRLSSEGRLPKIQVFVDSPLSVNATRIFRLHPECYDADLVDYIEFDPDPFGFRGLKYITEIEDSKKLNHIKEPCVIISASGMANAGRIRHHIFNNMENPKNTILIVGYCAPGTLGHEIRQRKSEIFLFGEKKRLQSQVEIMDSFSAHADEIEMISFLQNQKSAQQIYLVHGSDEARQKFKEKLAEEGFGSVHLPSLEEVVSISVVGLTSI
jgi:metallo-beta-lactamase family protein